MNIGELFFSLGFKSEGLGEAKEFESALSNSQEVIAALAEAMDRFGMILEKIALKMGAVTKQELEEIKTKSKLSKTMKDANNAEKQGNGERTKAQGIIGALNTKMKGYFGNLAAARVQLLATTGALTYFVKKASDAAVQIDKISSLTGLSSGAIQRLGDMAAQTGGSIEDITGAVQSFQKNSVDIMLGRGGNIGAFQFMGIDPHQDPMKILDQLSVKLKTMPTALGTNMARDMGVSDDLIYLLKNRENIEQAPDETFLTDKEIKRLKDFNFYFNRVFEQSKRVLQKFAAFLTPVATHVVYFFDRMGSMFGDIMTKMAPMFDGLKKWMPVIVAMGTALFIAFFPMQAVLALLALALEDVYSFMKGDDSVLGRMVKYFQETDNYVMSIVSGLKTLASLLTLGLFDKQLGNLAPSFGDKAQDAIGSFLNFMNKPQVGPLLGPQGSMTGNTNNNNITINVDGSRSPKETAIAVEQELNKKIQSPYWENNVPAGAY